MSARGVEYLDRHARQMSEQAHRAAHPPSEDAIALSFAERHAPGLRYVAPWNQWLEWDGARWREDSTLAVFDMVRRVCREIAHSVSEDKRAAISKAVTVAAVTTLARSDRRIAATVDQWDVDPWVLNTSAGIVDLKTGELQPHDPDAYMTKMTSAAPAGECPRWLSFLAGVTDGDVELQKFLQRVAGYALTGSTREHALFFLYGTGGNGKGVFLNTLTRLLGDYARVAPMDVFTERRFDQHPTELAMLRGARLVVAQETEEGRRWAESRIKALPGGDPITARFMRRDFFTFTPAFKLLIAGNHKPILRNVDEAMRRRLHLIPFTVTVPPERRDHDLEEKLREEWPGILQWAIDGCLEYQRHGLNPPEIVREATDEYFEAQNDFATWLEECADRDTSSWELTGVLFASWKRWAEAANVPAGSEKSLADKLEAAGFTKKRTNSARGWQGLRLKDTARADQTGDWSNAF